MDGFPVIDALFQYYPKDYLIWYRIILDRSSIRWLTIKKLSKNDSDGEYFPTIDEK